MAGEGVEVMSTHDDMADWPPALREVGQVIGPELALQLAQRVGGLSAIYIPRKPNPSHPWAQAIGADAFASLCRALGGARLELPRGAYASLKKRKVIELAEAGLSRREIAMRCGVTMRYVRLTLQGLRMPKPVDQRQQRLFGDVDS